MLGAEHPNTLTGASILATSLSRQGKNAEAERIEREVHEMQKRVLGAEHPRALTSASNQAATWLGPSQSKASMPRPSRCCMLRLHLQRVLGAAHPDTLAAADNLKHVRAGIRATPATNAAALAAAGVARLLPAGTHVLAQPPQRLFAKPEHNGKRARVVSFDARTGRYAVALEDGKELSLKAECMARAGCAAAGCASEEASSVCSRCQAVRYCSRKCQRTDWKAHKPVCTAAQP